MLSCSRSLSTAGEARPSASQRAYPPETLPARDTGRFSATYASKRKCAGSGGETRRPAGRRRAALLLAATGLLLLTAAPAAAQPINQNDLVNLPQFVDATIASFLGASSAATRIHDAGDDMTQAIALILIVWTGLHVAFSGAYNPWELIKFVFILGWPLFFINFYYTDIPGLGLSFPRLVAGMGDWISVQFGANILGTALANLMDLAEKQAEIIGENWGSTNIWTAIVTGGQQVIHALLATGIITTFVLGMVLVTALALAQVIFAKIAMAILIAIGPIFIPFMIVPKMDFLFWGWLKAMVQYSLYSAIAIIQLNIWTTIIDRYVLSMTNLAPGFQALTLLSGVWLVPVFLVLVCALVCILKIGDLAGMIVGAGSDGGGVIGGAFMAGRIVAAPARVAAAPLKGGLPA